jgi:hypothetical protein
MSASNQPYIPRMQGKDTAGHARLLHRINNPVVSRAERDRNGQKVRRLLESNSEDNPWRSTTQFTGMYDPNSWHQAMAAWELKGPGRRVKTWEDSLAAEQAWTESQGGDKEYGKAWRTPWAEDYSQLKNQGVNKTDSQLYGDAFARWADRTAGSPEEADAWKRYFRNTGLFANPVGRPKTWESSPWAAALLG